MNHTPLNYALWLLGRRDRSVGEIQTKMREKKFEENEIEETIKQLKKLNFLDDAKFAKHYISNQLIIKPLGKYQLKQKLKRKFIPDEIIEKAMIEIGPDREMELAREAALKYQKSKIKDQNDKLKFKEKLGRHLISRGFDWEIVKKVIENLKTNI